MIPAALAAGALLGLAAGFSPGPLTVLVISTTLSHSVLDGLKVAVAPLITDAPIVLVSLLIIEGLDSQAAVLGAIALAGALFVAYLGLETIKVRAPQTGDGAVASHALKKGVLANFLSPHPYIFWFTVGAPQTVIFSANGWQGGAAFMGAFYAGLVGAKVCLAIVAAKARSLISGLPYLYVMRTLGALLVLLALFLAWDGLALLGAM